MTHPLQLRFEASPSSGEVSALLSRPPHARALYLFGHGAGAGMRHVFMEAVCARLDELGVATMRYHFPYMEAGRGGPNPTAVLVSTVRSAVAAAEEAAPDLVLFAGGKSMGGRMTSLAASEARLAGVRGLAFFGFPLHAAGRDSSDRGAHLGSVGLPMLFLQGTRDKLANLDLLRPLLEDIVPVPTLHVFEGADHGFHVLKRSGRSDEDVLDELCQRFSSWVDSVLLGAAGVA